MIRASRHADSRAQLIIPGAWLIGLGLVFLIRDAMGWEWTEAWPLFVILGGAAGIVSALVTRKWTRRGIWGLWFPIAVLAIGIVLLASTTGSFGMTLPELGRWWPVLVIGIGIWFLFGAVLARDDKVAADTLAVPLDGLSQAEIRLNFGGGELRVGPAPTGMLLSGSFVGGVERRDHGPGRIELRPYDPAFAWWGGRPLIWDVGLTAEIPVDLRLDTGATRSSIDLSALRIRRLEVHTGASETHIRLPAAGASSVRVEAGVASVAVEIPAGVSARIRSKMGLGSTRVDEARFPGSLDGWASPDYETATNRVDIDIAGGLGSVRVS